MKKHLKLKDAVKLERFQTALNSATTDAAIAENLSKFGLPAESLEEGKTLLEASHKAYEISMLKRERRSRLWHEFNRQKVALNKLYSKHRRIAKLVFAEDPEVYDSLGLNKKFTATYAYWIKLIKAFYLMVDADNAIKEKLVVLNITADEIDAAVGAISPLEQARVEYMIAKGASQDSTDAKNLAFESMDDWMENFFDLSKVALRKNPQLMETFGVIVKN